MVVIVVIIVPHSSIPYILTKGKFRNTDDHPEPFIVLCLCLSLPLPSAANPKY